MATYAISIKEETLDLIQFLNSGVRPKVEKEDTVFTFDIVDNNIENTDVKLESKIYDEEGYAPPYFVWLIS